MNKDSFEKMFDQIFADLGHYDHNMSRSRPYNGQPHTDTGIRGATEVKGITFRDLRDCFIRAYILSHYPYVGNTLEPLQPNMALREEAVKGEHAVICEADIYNLKGDIDPIAVFQNFSCEVEKIMGIYPNVPELKANE